MGTRSRSIVLAGAICSLSFLAGSALCASDPQKPGQAWLALPEREIVVDIVQNGVHSTAIRRQSSVLVIDVLWYLTKQTSNTVFLKKEFVKKEIEYYQTVKPTSDWEKEYDNKMVSLLKAVIATGKIDWDSFRKLKSAHDNFDAAYPWMGGYKGVDGLVLKLISIMPDKKKSIPVLSIETQWSSKAYHREDVPVQVTLGSMRARLTFSRGGKVLFRKEYSPGKWKERDSGAGPSSDILYQICEDMEQGLGLKK